MVKLTKNYIMWPLGYGTSLKKNIKNEKKPELKLGEIPMSTGYGIPLDA